MSKRADKPRFPSNSKESIARTRVVRQLWEWATEEMEYSFGEDGSLTEEDLHMLVPVRGDLVGFWEYVVKHVKSQSAEVIRGNVFLHSAGGSEEGTVGKGMGGEGERAAMERERCKLMSEQQSLKTAVQQMQRDIAQLRDTITQLDEAGDSVQMEVSRLSQGSALLLAHSHSSQEMSNIVQEFVRRIRARVDVFHRPAGREAAYFTKQDRMEQPRSGEESNSAVTLESACTHEVRIIVSHLEDSLSDRESEDQRVVLVREHSWKQIESLLSRYPPAEILSSLVEVTQLAAHKLQSHTLAIDLNKDAQQLEYSYDVAGMRDTSEKASLLHAVERQLLEAQLSHIQRSLESERAQKAALETWGQATKLQEATAQLLQEFYSENTTLELAKQHMRLDLECAGSAAALERLLLLCSSLGQARDKRKKVINDLQAKLRKIQEFAKVADTKQRKIQALVAHNSSAKDRLLKQSTELQLYVQRNVLGHRDALNSVAGALKDGVTREVQLFSCLDLHRLLKPPRLDLPTCDLSISRLAARQPSGHPSWRNITLSLKLPTNPAPDTLLTKLLEAQEKVTSLDRNVAKVNEVLPQMRAIALNKEDAQAVLQQCGAHNHQLLERGVPALQVCLSRASRGLADCEKTAEILENWWVQPAQYLTPWATQGGINYGGWVEQWRVLAAKFSELQQ